MTNKSLDYEIFDEAIKVLPIFICIFNVLSGLYTSKNMSDKTLSASAAGASYLILLQVLSRALTFALNQVLLRFLSPELLGVSAQLELYSISVLYFARESIRVAAQRQSHGAQIVVNLSYLAIASGIMLAWGFAWLYLHSSVPDVPFLRQSLGTYAVAAVVELFSEPAFLVAQQKLLYKIRASAEGSATVAKCLATVGTAVWASKYGIDIGALPFALGQMTYAGMLFLVYTVRVSRSMHGEKCSLLLSKLEAQQPAVDQPYLGLFSRALTKLSASLTLQSTLKYFLTQSDGLIVATYASLADQGAYALASNYGGLVARMLFQPIEEAGRNLFARLCVSPTPVAESDSVKAEARKKVEEKAVPQDSDNVKQAVSILVAVLHLYSILSLLALALGPTLAPLLLTLVAGRRWSSTSAPDVLAMYCYYIPLLAYNGIIEAFISAVATPVDLRSQSMWMTAFSAIFAGSAYLLLGVYGWGAKGVVMANCINMGLRIMWGGSFINSWFKQRRITTDISRVVPAGASIGCTVAAYAVLLNFARPKASEPQWMLMAKTGAVAGALSLSIVFFERRFFVECYRMLKPNR